jgi:hypothetical protein
MSSFTDLIRDNPKEANRLSAYALKQNPNMKNFRDFESALKDAFSVDARGQGALNFLNDEESVMLFETRTIQEAIRQNAGDGYADAIQDARNFEVQRKVAKGEPTKKSDIKLIYTPRKFTSRTSTGKEYQKGYRIYNPSDIRFLQVRKARGMKPKQIINEYNQHFKANPRSESSIKTKLHRIK